MRLQGNNLLTTEAEMTVTGPYPHLQSDTGKHVNGRGKAIGRHLGQEQTEDLADFLIQGQFIRTRALAFETAD